MLPDRCIDLEIPPSTKMFQIEADSNLMTHYTHLFSSSKTDNCNVHQFIHLFKFKKSHLCTCCEDAVTTVGGKGDVVYRLNRSLEIRLSEHKELYPYIQIIRKCRSSELCKTLHMCIINYSRRMSMCEQQQLIDGGLPHFNISHVDHKLSHTSIQQGPQIYNIYQHMHVSWKTAKHMCELEGSSLLSLRDKSSLKLLLTAMQADRMAPTTFGILFIGLYTNKVVGKHKFILI